MTWVNPTSFKVNNKLLLGSATIALVSVGALAFKGQAKFPLLFKNNHTINNDMPAAIATSPLTAPTAKLSEQEVKNGKIWNRFADNYSKQPIKDEESYQKKLEITRTYLTPNDSVLEFGCGTGGTAILHAPYVKNLRAIDLSSRMIEIAEEKKQAAEVTNVKFECTGIDSLDVPDESFDVVLGLSILHLLPNHREVLEKVRTHLKPGGYFISSTTCIGDQSMARVFGMVAPSLSYFGLIPQVQVFTKAELRTDLENAGFTIEQEFHPGKDKAVFFVARKL